MKLLTETEIAETTAVLKSPRWYEVHADLAAATEKRIATWKMISEEKTYITNISGMAVEKIAYEMETQRIFGPTWDGA